MELESGCATIDHHRWGKITFISEVTFTEDSLKELFSKMSDRSLSECLVFLNDEKKNRDKQNNKEVTHETNERRRTKN